MKTKTPKTQQTATAHPPLPEPPANAQLAGSPITASCSASSFPPVDLSDPPYSSFSQFTRDQLLQISAWLDDHIYDKVIDLIKEEYSVEISQSALQRFYAKTAFKKHLAQTPETAEAAAQVLEFAATGKPCFTDASLRVPEQTAFQLSPTCHKQPADLLTLNRITTIICRQKNTAIRERHAKVQETKCSLRQREFDWKKRQGAKKKKENRRMSAEKQMRLVRELFGELPDPPSDSPSLDVNLDGSLQSEWHPDPDQNTTPANTPTTCNSQSAPRK